VSIHWKTGQYKLPDVASDHCSIQAVPPPSSPILNVTISAITFPEDNIQFGFSWEPPTSTNGDVTDYLACLSSHVLKDKEGSDNLTCVYIVHLSGVEDWLVPTDQHEYSAREI